MLEGGPQDAGLCCLGAVAQRLGARFNLPELKRRFPTAQSMSVRQLVDTAGALDLIARPLRCELDDLAKVRRPALIQWGRTAYAFYDRPLADGGARVFVPWTGWQNFSRKELDRVFTGIAIEFTPAPAFAPPPPAPLLPLLSLFKLTPEIAVEAGKVLALAAVVQIYTVAGPLYGRTVLDEAIPKNDHELLNALLLAFIVLALFNSGASALRDLATQKLTSILSFDMTQRIVRHLVRLPLPWFQSRNQAEILGKLASVDAVRMLITNGAMVVLVDGLVSITTLTMLVLTAPGLAVAAVVAFLIYVAIRLVAIPISQRLAARAFEADIIDRGNRMETLRAIQTVKVMGGEDVRIADWSLKFLRSIQTAIDSAAVTALFNALQGAVKTCATLVMFYLGARAVMRGDMTIGLLTAALAYQGQFTDRAFSLVEQYFQWRMLDLHLMRLGDIALSPIEEGADQPLGDVSKIRGELIVEDVSFRYGPALPLVLDGLSLTIAAGEHVAITGRSGAGKSTLIKVLTGLYPPSSGTVRLDGTPVARLGPRTVRRAMGVVMQNDELLTGSVAENVSFFDPEVDMDWVWRCLEMAGIDEEVRAMPMREHSPVGEMGMAVSGGQRQRFQIARALYKRPRLLVLDEATSHLDVAREAGILAMLKAQQVTVIHVAHRPETIASADRVLRFENGVVTG